MGRLPLISLTPSTYPEPSANHTTPIVISSAYRCASMIVNKSSDQAPSERPLIGRLSRHDRPCLQRSTNNIPPAHEHLSSTMYLQSCTPPPTGHGCKPYSIRKESVVHSPLQKIEHRFWNTYSISQTSSYVRRMAKECHTRRTGPHQFIRTILQH